MIKKLTLLFFTLLCAAVLRAETGHIGLNFAQLPTQWDEAIPLGNGIMGTLIYQKDGKLRLALDRADLWDLRPVKVFNGPSYSYKAICEAVERKDMTPIYEMIDARTQKDIAPTKIPAGAIEFAVAGLGEVEDAVLDVRTALCTVTWKNGTVGRFFTNAIDRKGYFQFTNLPGKIAVDLICPAFELPEGEKEKANSLSRLGYKNGKIVKKENRIGYKQKVYGNVSYDIEVKWEYTGNDILEGTFCITTDGTWYSEPLSAGKQMKDHAKDFATACKEHSGWWKNYWQQCSISLPDKVLERQWYLEMYKFGASSRKDAPPICLQAVWTADNGQTPPWRGDFHNDLNTQLSYWPGYASNHLEESEVFTDWLWRIKDNSEAFTRQFFGVEGMNVPCISTLDGKNLGGWNPYSHQPTAGGWLTHHFYMQWKYSADETFLKERAYPWVKEVARFFENISVRNKDGKRKLPISSSPEINDNRIDAWFKETTNYDLACIKLTYKVAAEMATALGLAEEAGHWQAQNEEWPDFDTDSTGLTIAPGYPLSYTHRHLSNMLAIHPFGLLDVSQGKDTERLIRRSIHHFEEMGTGGWVGYTYSWLANMQARIFDGDAAARSLHIFAKAFCSPNSFHLNGDQLKKGYSGLTYRPFTLEGNFACASAIQEMLLQSHTDIIKVFPAIPESWRDASFRDMRAMGAFLVSADYKDGKVERVIVRSEKGGRLRILNPFTNQVDEKDMVPGQLLEMNRTR
ncbi:glycoside hydrolase family 95 protein [Bacteroides muris (ex Fokt et al. 2023)]|uniref:Glycoside hydrolase family 95 protein n=1 Tax=Bacteroides muris (ex Fokt et al. 2023) TaxID=2937417 RepID=A0A9X2SRK2_9BACE|nr:glycoside hydrolase family 95 protein [Bacteroides muris (ex Fokt et al. 2023)]MCR6504119.1 glycoside hydrolase family 95 protein [Bacteroides muris (ex Fokt et al. 2023)]